MIPAALQDFVGALDLRSCPSSSMAVNIPQREQPRFVLSQHLRWRYDNADAESGIHLLGHGDRCGALPSLRMGSRTRRKSERPIRQCKRGGTGSTSGSRGRPLHAERRVDGGRCHGWGMRYARRRRMRLRTLGIQQDTTSIDDSFSDDTRSSSKFPARGRAAPERRCGRVREGGSWRKVLLRPQ